MLELKLRGAELSLFAIINGYSSQGDGCYYGTRANLAKRCGLSSVRTVDAALASLIKKGMVVKFDAVIKGKECVAYAVNPDFFQDVQNLHTPGAKNAPQQGAKNAHFNNKDIEKKSNIPPSPQEVADYARERGYIDPQGFAAHFVDYYTIAKWRLSNGKPMQNWKKAVITWEPNNKFKRFPAGSSSSSTGRQLSEEDFLKSIR